MDQFYEPNNDFEWFEWSNELCSLLWYINIDTDMAWHKRGIENGIKVFEKEHSNCESIMNVHLNMFRKPFVLSFRLNREREKAIFIERQDPASKSLDLDIRWIQPCLYP